MPVSGKRSGCVSQIRGSRLSSTPSASRRPGDAVVALHRLHVAAPVATADRHPGDQVVQDELVQHDDAGPLAESVDDPGVRVGVVADVVEADVGMRRALAGLGDDDLLEPLAQRRQEQRRVVGDPRSRRRQR